MSIAYSDHYSTVMKIPVHMHHFLEDVQIQFSYYITIQYSKCFHQKICQFQGDYGRICKGNYGRNRYFKNCYRASDTDNVMIEGEDDTQ